MLVNVRLYQKKKIVLKKEAITCYRFLLIIIEKGNTARKYRKFSCCHSKLILEKTTGHA